MGALARCSAGGVVRKPRERMEAPSVELQLPRCASAALLTRLGGGSEGVFAFFFIYYFFSFFLNSV